MIVEWDEPRRGLTMWSSTQVPHSLKATLVGYLGLPENAVRVIAPDVGGAFGVKLQPYPEEIVLGLAAEQVGRPIKWVEDRYEHFLASTHGREQYHDVEVGYDDNGRILAIHDHAVTNTGAYLQRLTLVEPFIGVSMLSGPMSSSIATGLDSGHDQHHAPQPLPRRRPRAGGVHHGAHH